MYQKNNPWLSLVALLIMALIIVLNLTGCTEASAETPARFTVEYAGNSCEIITDNETGVQYLFYSYGTTHNNRAGGLCKLED